MTQKEEFIKIDYREKSAKMQIWVVRFIDNGHHIAYIPSLKLSAYGANENEALKMLFEDVVTDMFNHLFDLSEIQIANELAKFGWKHNRLFKKKFSNTPFIDKGGILRNFNLPKETLISQEYIENLVAA